MQFCFVSAFTALARFWYDFPLKYCILLIKIRNTQQILSKRFVCSPVENICFNLAGLYSEGREYNPD